MRVIPLQCVCILDHHNVHFKCLMILSFKALTKLKEFILCLECISLNNFFVLKCLFLCLVIFCIHLYLIHIFCVCLLSFGGFFRFFLNFFECIYCKVSLRLLANTDFFSSGNGSSSGDRDLNNIVKIKVELIYTVVLVSGVQQNDCLFFFFRFFSIVGCYKILNALHKDLAVYLFYMQ